MIRLVRRLCSGRLWPTPSPQLFCVSSVIAYRSVKTLLTRSASAYITSMVKKVSDVEDGFSAKRASDKKPAKKRKPVEGEHTIPPPPIKHILGSFTLSNPASARAIRDYVASQARDERVQHAEKVTTEHVFDRDYDCWDVHTDRDRYWVITSPTNLYSQQYFPSLDFTLSFHVGVTARIMAMQRGAPDAAQGSRLRPVWRRWEQAAESHDTAEEAEDFQAVGMRCRETLIQLVRRLSKPDMVPAGKDPPKHADVIGWSELIANTIAPGGHNEHVRTHLKALAKSAWQLSNWLTHTSEAARFDATFVLDATHNVVSGFGTALIRFESGAPERCPECGSYAMTVGFNPEMPRPYVSECERCGWQSPEERQRS